MARPLFATGIAFLIAIRFAFLIDGGNLLPYSAAAVLSAVLLLCLRDRLPFVRIACAVCLSTAVAFASYALYFAREIAPVIGLSGKTAEMEGLVTEFDRGVQSASYTVTASVPGRNDLPKTFPVILRSMEPLEVAVGDTVRFRAEFSPAGESPYYKSRGISVIGMNVTGVTMIPAGRFAFSQILLRLRGAMGKNLSAKLSEESAHVLSAMILGQKNNIPPEVSTAMGKAGTSHLLAISGLHLSILSGFVLKATGKSRLGALAAILSSLFFVFLVGFSASLLRSFIMTAVSLSGRLASKRSDSLNSLGLALIICCGISPFWTLGWGLWLSAASTLGIILFSATVSAALKKRLGTGRFARFVAGAGGVSIAAYAFTLPLLLLMSGWISLVSPLANILVSPFIAFSILGGVACAVIPGTPLAAVYLARATDYAARIIIQISGTMASLPFSIIAIDESYLLIWLAAACAIAALLVKYRADKRLIVYACALLAFSLSLGTISLRAANRGKLEFVTLSGGNAAVLLRGEDAVILGAPDAYEVTNLLRYLDFRGVRAVPALIAADSEDNASSGMILLSERYPPDCVLGPNDEFICETIRDSLPGIPVYSGGYATLTVLGKSDVTVGLKNKNITISIGENSGQIVKSRRDYAERAPDGVIRVYNDGVMLLPDTIPPAFEPVGGYLFGESRVFLE